MTELRGLAQWSALRWLSTRAVAITGVCFLLVVSLPRGIAFDAAGNLYVADGTSRTSRLLRFLAPAPPTVTSPGFANQSPAVLLGQTAAGARVDVLEEDGIVGTAQATDGTFAVSAAIELNVVNAFSSPTARATPRRRRARSWSTGRHRRSPDCSPRAGAP